jgi:hypothetical protein
MNDAQPGNFDLMFGADFGKGFAMYVDGVLNTVRRDDIWWSENWDD